MAPELPIRTRKRIWWTHGGPTPVDYRWHVSRSCCPWKVRFSRELKEPAFAAREALAGRDARTLARELLGMSQEEFSRAFKGSPMKRAKLRGLKRNAAVMLGNVGTPDDIPVLEQALDDEEPLVREHAAWARERLRRRRSGPPDQSMPGQTSFEPS